MKRIPWLVAYTCKSFEPCPRDCCWHKVGLEPSISQRSPAILPDQLALTPAWLPKSQELGLPACEVIPKSCTMVQTSHPPAADTSTKYVGPYVQLAPLLYQFLTV